MLSPDEIFLLMGLELPPNPQPKGIYKPILIIDKRVYLSGHGPLLTNNQLIIGKIGRELSLEEGVLAAKQVGLTMISTLIANLRTLNSIKRVVKVFGMVNCEPDFLYHPQIINGCSELFAKIWGENYGIGVRSAVGMGSLPDNIPVEIESEFEIW